MTANKKFLITTGIAVLSLVATLYVGLVGSAEHRNEANRLETNTINGSNNIVIVGEGITHLDTEKTRSAVRETGVIDWFSAARSEAKFVSGFYEEPVFPFEESQKTEWFHHGSDTIAGCWLLDALDKGDVGGTLNTTLFLRLESFPNGLGVRFGNDVGDIVKDAGDLFLIVDIVHGAYFDTDGSVRYLNHSWKRISESELVASHMEPVVGGSDYEVKNLYRMIECL